MPDPQQMFPDCEVSRLLARADLAASPLGAYGTWPAALRTIVQLMLNSKQQMYLVWGKEHTLLYNDAYVSILGEKHPAALLAPMWASWGQLRAESEAKLREAFAGKPLAFRRLASAIRRNGRLEQAWFDVSYTPVQLDDGSVGGALGILNEVTEDYVAQRDLARQAGELRQLFENAPGFMALTRGPQHVYELTNGAYRRLIGMRNPIGRPIREALPELEGQMFFGLLDDVYATGRPYSGRRTPVHLRRDADGPLEERWVDFIYQPVLDQDGKVSGIFIEGSDVTGHVALENKWKEAAAAAERERDRLNAVLDTTPTAIVIADASGKLVGSNEAMGRLWGMNYPQSATWEEYSTWKGWWLDEWGARLRPVRAHEWPLTRALRGEDNVREVIGIEPFDRPGESRTILACAAPIRDKAGAVTGALVAQTDITDQVRAEAALRESEARFRAITNAIPQMVWSNLPDGTHDFYNDGWREFTGLPHAMDNDTWETVVHPDDRPGAHERWHRALTTGEPYEVEYRLRHAASGQYRWCLGRAIPVRNANGEIVRWMGTVTDVHEARKVAEELQRASVRKDEFLAMLAHELRNPLAPVKAATDLLRVCDMEPARLRQVTDVIDRQVRHMTELVDDLLDVSRVTRGLVELDKKPLDLKTVVSNAVEQAKPLIEARAHALHVHMGAAHAQVCGDHTRLVQVIVNLLTNAAKYTQHGGSIDVRVEAIEATREVRIAVADNGSGIDAGLLPFVFDTFSQGVRTPDRAQGGLGLGLALVRSLVDLHGGRVAAHSEGAGRGSTFTVVLPLLAHAAEPGEPAPPADTPAAGTRCSVMVVDDNTDAADSLATLLEALGHEVHVRYDPHDVVRDAVVLQPDALILDIGLPGMDGFELARRLRAEPATGNALLVALTGYGQAHDRVLSRAAGFDRHFVKPVDILDLEEALATVPARVRAGALAG